MKILDRQNLSDVLQGSVILGAGGGGDLQEGFDLIDAAISANKTFKLVQIDEVPDEALVCTPYMLGAISPLTDVEEQEYQKLDRIAEHPILVAYSLFQQILGSEFYAATPCELGGSNTAVAFYCAAMNDHYVIDADPAGRAVPEITHSTYYLNKLPASPIIAVNEFGESFQLNDVKDDRRAEVLVRALSRVSRNDIAAIDHALPMRLLRACLIQGTITRAMRLGETWRRLQSNPENAISAVAHSGQGKVCFQGRAHSVHYSIENGFTVGSIQIVGQNQFHQQHFRISVKNENLVGWLNDKVYVTIPDLICLFDTVNGEPISNPDVLVNQDVTVVVLPSPQEFRTKEGLEIFGPGYAGLDVNYKPI